MPIQAADWMAAQWNPSPTERIATTRHLEADRSTLRGSASRGGKSIRGFALGRNLGVTGRGCSGIECSQSEKFFGEKGERVQLVAAVPGWGTYRKTA